MAYENLLIENAGGIATVTVNRPKVLNALNHQTLTELARAFDEAEADASVKLVIVTGAGQGIEVRVGAEEDRDVGGRDQFLGQVGVLVHRAADRHARQHQADGAQRHQHLAG